MCVHVCIMSRCMRAWLVAQTARDSSGTHPHPATPPRPARTHTFFSALRRFLSSSESDPVSEELSRSRLREEDFSFLCFLSFLCFRSFLLLLSLLLPMMELVLAAG